MRTMPRHTLTHHLEIDIKTVLQIDRAKAAIVFLRSVINYSDFPLLNKLRQSFASDTSVGLAAFGRIYAVKPISNGVNTSGHGQSDAVTILNLHHKRI